MSRRQTKEEGHCCAQETRIGNEVALPSTIASSMPVSRIREIMELAWEELRSSTSRWGPGTCHAIIRAAHEAARAGHTRYAPNAGLLCLSCAGNPGGEGHPAQRLRGASGAGGGDARGHSGIYLVLRALLEPGDEVLLPDPAWPNFRMISHFSGRVCSRTPWSQREISCQTSSAW